MNKASIFMSAGWVGLAGITVGFSQYFSDQLELVGGIGLMFAVFAGWTMFFTRNADEYTRGLWTSAASLAFAAVLLLFLGLPFAEGFYDGFMAGLNDTDPALAKRDTTSDAVIFIAIVGFYIGLFWKRIRGGV